MLWNDNWISAQSLIEKITHLHDSELRNYEEHLFFIDFFAPRHQDSFQCHKTLEDTWLTLRRLRRDLIALFCTFVAMIPDGRNRNFTSWNNSFNAAYVELFLRKYGFKNTERRKKIEWKRRIHVHRMIIEWVKMHKITCKPLRDQQTKPL